MLNDLDESVAVSHRFDPGDSRQHREHRGGYPEAGSYVC